MIKMADQKTIKKAEKPKVDIKKTGKEVMAPPTPEQQQSDMMSYLNNLRGGIILSYDGSKETASRAFDDVASKLVQYVRYAQKSDEMIAELKKENEKLKKGKK